MYIISKLNFKVKNYFSVGYKKRWNYCPTFSSRVHRLFLTASGRVTSDHELPLYDNPNHVPHLSLLASPCVDSSNLLSKSCSSLAIILSVFVLVKFCSISTSYTILQCLPPPYCSLNMTTRQVRLLLLVILLSSLPLDLPAKSC